MELITLQIKIKKIAIHILQKRWHFALVFLLNYIPFMFFQNLILAESEHFLSCHGCPQPQGSSPDGAPASGWHLQKCSSSHKPGESAAALYPHCSSTGKGSPGWMCSLPSRRIQHIQPQRSAVSVFSVVLQLCNTEHPRKTEIPVLLVACFLVS